VTLDRDGNLQLWDLISFSSIKTFQIGSGVQDVHLLEHSAARHHNPDEDNVWNGLDIYCTRNRCNDGKTKECSLHRLDFVTGQVIYFQVSSS
jgi:hypothetical protein